MQKTVRYIAVMEGEEGRPGSSRAVLIASHPDTVEKVVRIIGDQMGWQPAPNDPPPAPVSSAR